MRLTFLEWCVVIFLLAWIAIYWWMIYRLFHQTDVIGVLKWGFLLVSLGLASNSASGRRK